MKKATNILVLLGGVLLLTGLVLAFYVAPVAIGNNDQPMFSQKIFYFHVPVAWSSMLAFLLAAVFGAMFLTKKERKYDFLSLAAVELGFVFGLAVEWTGIIWDKAAWGTWWQWEPRLTTYLILMLMYAGYFVLRSSMSEESAKARFASVYAIIAAVNVPLTFFAIRLIPSIHPTLFKSNSTGLEGPMLVAFLVSMFGMTAFFVGLLLMRYETQLMGEEVDFMKNQLGG